MKTIPQIVKFDIADRAKWFLFLLESRDKTKLLNDTVTQLWTGTCIFVAFDFSLVDDRCVVQPEAGDLSNPPKKFRGRLHVWYTWIQPQ